jgi:hypothetical protein
MRTRGFFTVLKPYQYIPKGTCITPLVQAANVFIQNGTWIILSSLVPHASLRLVSMAWKSRPGEK